MLSYFSKQIKYCTVPYLGRFVQDTPVCYCMHFLYSHIWPASQTIFWSFLASAAMLQDGTPVLFCSICQLLGPCLAEVICKWSVVMRGQLHICLVFQLCVITQFSLGTKINVRCKCPCSFGRLAHFWICSAFDLRTWSMFICPKDDSHAPWSWPSYSLRMHTNQSGALPVPVHQAFAVFFQFVVIANLSPSPFFSLILNTRNRKVKPFFSGWTLFTGPASSLAFFLISSEKILWFVTLLQADGGLLHSVHPYGGAVLPLLKPEAVSFDSSH